MGGANHSLLFLIITQMQTYIDVNNKDKVILIGNDKSKCIDVIASLLSHDDTITIANTFSTDISLKDQEISNWTYYMDNDDLYLAFRNNALLCIEEDSLEVSHGITKEEAYMSVIIPMTYSMFNMTSPRSIKGVSIVWIDSISSHKTKKMIKDSNEFMQASKKYPILYFTDEDNVVSIASTIYHYLKSDEIEREKILKECN